MPPQNLPLWHKDCFELKAVEKKQIQEKSSSSLYFPKVKHKCVQKLIIWNTRHLSAPRQHLRTLQKSLCWLAIIFQYSLMYLLSHNLPLLQA